MGQPKDAAFGIFNVFAENYPVRIFLEAGDFLRAHVNADRAASLFASIDNSLHCAKAWDEIARIHLAEKRLDWAERAARKAVSLVTRGDQAQVLAECLVTLGTILGERGLVEADEVLGKAARLCASIGDRAQAAEASEARIRILKNGRRLITSISNSLRPIEHEMIKELLVKHKGVIARVAAELEIPYDTLMKKLRTQYTDLISVRRPIRHRRKSVLGTKSGKIRK